MVISTLLNILLSMVARTTELPFYIDTVGTIVATALGGVVPGILTAFVTNAVNFFMDGESIFYASLNMLIAIVSAGFFGDYSKYRKLKKKDLREATHLSPSVIAKMGRGEPVNLETLALICRFLKYLIIHKNF